MMRLLLVHVQSVLVLLLSVTVSVTVATTATTATTCLAQGFDPTNLSCDTCVLLQTTDYHLACLECCQSYKTLDSKTSRYQAAVLVHVPGANSEIDNFVTEELQDILDTKQGFTIKESQGFGGGGGMGGFFMQGMRPSTLYFFKESDQVTATTTTQEYAATAQEEIILHGWSKDDFKDMIQTILPDKK